MGFVDITANEQTELERRTTAQEVGKVQLQTWLHENALSHLLHLSVSALISGNVPVKKKKNALTSIERPMIIYNKRGKCLVKDVSFLGENNNNKRDSVLHILKGIILLILRKWPVFFFI